MNPGDPADDGRPAPGRRTGAPASEKAGDRIGTYKLLEQIGEGGCGAVFVAEQNEPVRRRVALKIIKLGMDTKQVVARFEAERQALALMDHPNICKVLDAGATQTGRPFFAMELVRGIKVTEYCDQNKLSTAERLKLFVQICQAIQHAHEKQIVHRDIKPSNVLVSVHDGQPSAKIIDFGIAKATNDQKLTDKTIYTAFEQFIGTPAYMSPEQAEMSGLEIDSRSDIYSLGVLLYELLTGQTPFDAQTLLKAGLDRMRQIIREEEPSRPSTHLSTLTQLDLTAVAERRCVEPSKLGPLIRGELDWVVMKCLEKNRARRYESATELAADIKRYLDQKPVAARPPSHVYRLRKLVQRHRFAVVASAAVAFVVVAGLAASVLLWRAQAAAHRRAAAANQGQNRLRQQNQVQQLREQAAGLRNNKARRAEYVKLLEQAVALSGEAYGKTNSETLVLTADLVEGYLDSGRATNALELARQWEATPGFSGNDTDTFRMQRMLARSYGSVNRQPDATRVLEDALRRQISVMGTNDLETHWTMGDLAGAYHDSDRLAEAISLYEPSIAFKRAKFGAANDHVQWMTRRLVTAYAAAGRLDDSFTLYKQALAPSNKNDYNTLRPPNLLDDLILGAIYQHANRGRTNDAHTLMTDSLKVSDREFGETHPETLAMLERFARIAWDMGWRSECLPLAEKSVARSSTVLPPEHPNLLRTKSQLGQLYDWSGLRSESVSTLEEVLSEQSKTLGTNHADLLATEHLLAAVYLNSNRAADALKLAEKCLAGREASQARDDTDVLRTKHLLARCYAALGRQKEAIPLLEEVLPVMISKKLWEIRGATGDLAAAYYDGGRPDAAVRLYEEYLSLAQAADGPTSKNALWVARRLIDTCNQAHSFTNTIKYSRELLALIGTNTTLTDQTSDVRVMAMAEAALGQDNDAAGHILDLLSLHPTENSYLDALVGIVARPYLEPLLPDSELTAGATWRYTTNRPATNWMAQSFDDRDWQTGPAPFGSGFHLRRTAWTASNVWMRIEFDLPAAPRSPLVFRAKFDDRVIAWINGVKAADQRNWSPFYRLISYSAPASALHKGRNILAVNAVNVALAGCVDVGLYTNPDSAEYYRALTNVFTRAIMTYANPSPLLLQARGTQDARRGQWNPAAADLAEVMKPNAVAQGPWAALAPLLLFTGDTNAYHRLRQELLKGLGTPSDPGNAERGAKASLLLPADGDVLDGAVKLADLASQAGEKYSGWRYIQFARGLAEYRRGNFAEASRSLSDLVTRTQGDARLEAQAQLVAAMAAYRQGNKQQAVKLFGDAANTEKTRLVPPDIDHPANAWSDWLIVQILRKEARALLGNDLASGANP